MATARADARAPWALDGVGSRRVNGLLPSLGDVATRHGEDARLRRRHPDQGRLPDSVAVRADREQSDGDHERTDGGVRHDAELAVAGVRDTGPGQSAGGPARSVHEGTAVTMSAALVS